MWTDPKWKRPESLLRLLNMDLEEDAEAYKGKRTKASRSRVLRLVALIQDAESKLALSITQNPDRNLWTACPSDLEEALDSVQETLRIYSMRPVVEIRGKFGEGGLHFDHAAGSSRPLGEQLAVWDITALAQRRQLHMMRECACGMWFYATRSDQRACSAGCRHRTYEQTEAFKEKRRSYMRDYYALKQSGRVK